MKSKFDLWLEKVDEERKAYWDSKFSYKPYEPIVVQKGRKYIKLISESSVWGFVAMVDGTNQGSPVKKGDLLLDSARVFEAQRDDFSADFEIFFEALIKFTHEATSNQTPIVDRSSHALK